MVRALRRTEDLESTALILLFFETLQRELDNSKGFAYWLVGDKKLVEI